MAAVSGAIGAEQTDPCAALEGAAVALCRNNQATLQQQERLEKLLQQQQERQNQLDKQQREVQQQLESMRLQNESLRKQLELEAANERSRPATADPTNVLTKTFRAQDLKSWKADNPWFGSDYNKTQFAMRYVNQLHQEHPDLAGRDLLNALSTKVDEKFGATR